MLLSRWLVVVLVIGLAAWLVGTRLVHTYVDAAFAAANAPFSVLQNYTDVYGNACQVAVVRLDNYELYASRGETDGYSMSAEDVVAQIEQARDDASIKGVLLLVNSPGGSIVAGEMIANALKGVGKPSAALILDVGDSAAYFAATGAERIIASTFSDVGDIGVTSSFISFASENTKNGDIFEQISSGKYKDAGNPNKALTVDERALLQSNVDEDYEHLIAQIAENRRMPLAAVRELADGSSMPGSRALSRGLIDEIGDLAVAEAWFASKLAQKDVTLCQ
jgi:signal peptide peptidase SppA